MANQEENYPQNDSKEENESSEMKPNDNEDQDVQDIDHNTGQEHMKIDEEGSEVDSEDQA